MALMVVEGITELVLSFEQLAVLPPEIAEDMLNAEAEVAIRYQKQSIDEHGLSPHGHFRESIKAVPNKDKDGNPLVDIYPTGIHHTNPGGTKVRNADIGFIDEFGAPRKNIKATQWMRTANEKAGPEVEAAGLKVYDEFLSSKNL